VRQTAACPVVASEFRMAVLCAGVAVTHELCGAGRCAHDPQPSPGVVVYDSGDGDMGGVDVATGTSVLGVVGRESAGTVASVITVRGTIRSHNR